MNYASVPSRIAACAMSRGGGGEAHRRLPPPAPDCYKEVPMVLPPFSPRTGHGAGHFPLRRLLPGAIGLALLVLALGGITAEAQVPAGCIPINQTACFANGITYTSNP